MKKITVPIPDSLYARIEERAKRIGVTKEELVSLWIWDGDYRRREADEQCESRKIAGGYDRNLPAGKDD